MSKLLDDFEKDLLSSYTDLAKEVDKEIRKFMKDIENAETPQEMLRLARKKNRLTLVQAQLADKITKINKGSVEAINEMMKNTFGDNWNYQKYLLEFQANTNGIIPLLNTEALDKLMQDTTSVFTKVALNDVKNRKVVIDLLKREMLNSITRGESVQQMSKRIRSVVDRSYKSSIRIARTENTRISSEARYQAAKKGEELGFKQTKTWVATKGARTRDTHRDLDGQTVPLDEPFVIHGKKAMYPGDFGRAEMDINCRCTFVINIDYDSMDLKPNKKKAKLFEEWEKDK